MFTTATPGGEVAARADIVRAERKLLPRFTAVSRVLLTCLTLAACDQSTTGVDQPGGPDPVDLTNAELWIVSGDLQEGEVGSELPDPLVVLVTDPEGNPIAGAPLTWIFGAGRGSGSGNQARSTTVELTTDGAGHASVEWQVGTTTGRQMAWVALPGVDLAAEVSADTTTDPSAAPPEGRGGNKGGGKKVGFEANTKSGPPAELEVTPTSLSLAVGESDTLTAVVRDRYGNESPDAVVEWTTTDASVAQVEADAVVAVGAGQADIIASSGKVSAAVSASVTKTPSVATQIVASASSVTLGIGETLVLTAVVLDQHGDEMFTAVVEWSSSDPAVATVAADGTLTGVAAGSIDVLASHDALTDTVSATIELAPPVPTEIVVSQTSLTLEVGETVVLTAVVLDQYGNVMPDVAVEWTSSDPSVVSVETQSPAPAPLSMASLPVTAESASAAGAAVTLEESTGE